MHSHRKLSLQSSCLDCMDLPGHYSLSHDVSIFLIHHSLYDHTVLIRKLVVPASSKAATTSTTMVIPLVLVARPLASCGQLLPVWPLRPSYIAWEVQQVVAAQVDIQAVRRDDAASLLLDDLAPSQEASEASGRMLCKEWHLITSMHLTHSSPTFLLEFLSLSISWLLSHILRDEDRPAVQILRLSLCVTPAREKYLRSFP